MKWNKVMVFIVLFALLGAGRLAYVRWSAENQYKNYEVTMDFEEIKKSAELLNITVAEALVQWKEAGINSVTLVEMTLESMKWHPKYKVKTEMDGYDLKIETTKEGIEFLKEGLSVLMKDREVQLLSDNQILISGKVGDLIFANEVARDFLDQRVSTTKAGKISKLELVGLGYDQEEIQMIQNAGLDLRFRPVYMEGLQDAEKSMERFFHMVNQYSHQSYALFYGERILGTDTHFQEMATKMMENKVAIAMVESVLQRGHLKQKGLDALIQETDYRAVRMFTTWNFIQTRYDYSIPGYRQGQEITNSFYRSIIERNIRIIYFKPFVNGGEMVREMEIYRARLTDLKDKLQRHGIHNVEKGEAMMVMPRIDPKPIYQMVIAWGVLAGLAILIDNLGKIKARYFYVASFALMGMVGIIYMLKIRLASVNMAFALLAIVVFSLLAIQFALLTSYQALQAEKPRNKKAAFQHGFSLLLGGVTIALVGSALEIAFYSGSRFYLELVVFKGVKVSQLLPLVFSLLLGAWYFAEYYVSKKGNRMQRMKELLNLDIKVWHMGILAIALGGIALLLVRSGHDTGVEPSSMELLLRNTLDDLLIARPRNKSFLIGYPAMILLGYLSFQQKEPRGYPILGFLATIGMANILNTFSHMKSPLYLSLYRVGFEIIFGLAMTILYVALLEIVSGLYRRWKERLS